MNPENFLRPLNVNLIKEIESQISLLFEKTENILPFFSKILLRIH